MKLCMYMTAPFLNTMIFQLYAKSVLRSIFGTSKRQVGKYEVYKKMAGFGALLLFYVLGTSEKVTCE